MAMESSIFPIPSEVVIPPAAFLAARGDLSMAGVIIAGTFGSYLGAAISYWLCASWSAGPSILRFGKYFLVHAGETGARRSLACALRGRGRFLCPAAAGHSPSDFLSRQDSCG